MTLWCSIRRVPAPPRRPKLSPSLASLGSSRCHAIPERSPATSASSSMAATGSRASCPSTSSCSRRTSRSSRILCASPQQSLDISRDDFGRVSIERLGEMARAIRGLEIELDGMRACGPRLRHEAGCWVDGAARPDRDEQVAGAERVIDAVHLPWHLAEPHHVRAHRGLSTGGADASRSKDRPPRASSIRIERKVPCRARHAYG